MIRLRHVSLSLLLFACGGGDAPGVSNPPPPPPPPPPSPPTATTVAIETGDAQQQEPGRAVPVAPAVRVRDQNGAPMAGVSVTFSVDSGGGSVSGGVVTTGSDGIAAVGGWTLGAGAGRNVLGATVPSLPRIRFVATARFVDVTVVADETVPAAGGTITFDRAGDPLRGLTLRIPPRAYKQDTKWSVSYTRTVKPPLPEGTFQVGPAIRIANGTGYADSVLSLRVPVTAGPDTLLGAFYYDSTSNWLEPLPIRERTASSVVIVTRHFNASALVRPGATGAARFVGTSRAVPFGSAVIVLAGIARPVAASKIRTSFRPGRDDWEYTNHGPWLAPRGICTGMSVTALYHHYSYASAAGPLFRLLDQVGSFDEDNPRGIRFASVVQAKHVANLNTFNSWLDAVDGGSPPPPDARANHYASMLVSMRVTGRPQYMSISGPSVAHSVVAYEVEHQGGGAAPSGLVAFADPNFPGLPRLLEVNSGELVSFTFLPQPGAIIDLITEFHFLGVSAVINTSELDSLYGEALAGTVGNSEFPRSSLEVFDGLSQSWRPFVDGTLIPSDTLLVRSTCPTCPHKRSTSDSRQVTTIHSPVGVKVAEDIPDADSGARAIVAPGPNRLGFTTRLAATPRPFVFRYSTFQRVSFTSVLTRIAPRAGIFKLDSLSQLSVTDAGTHPANARYRWTFANGGLTDVVNTTGSKGVSYIFRRNGNYDVTVEVRDAAGTLIGRDRTTAAVGCDSTPVLDVRDGRTYRVVCFSNGQAWMGENLQFNAPGSGCYDRLASNCTTFGRLYSWSAAMAGAASSSADPSGVRGACMAGWHVPSPAEWQKLITLLGGATAASPALRAFNTFGGAPPTNRSGMTLLGGGFWRTNFTAGLEDEFSGLGTITGLWTSFEGAPLGGTRAAQFLSIGHIPDGALLLSGDLTDGRSLRCVRN